MKIYKKGSAAYNRQKKTQKDQAAAAARPKKPLDQHGRRFLHPDHYDGVAQRKSGGDS